MADRDRALGQKLLDWRMRRNRSQAGLANKLGITRVRMWDWETNGVPHGLVRLVGLAMKELQRETDVA